MAIKEMIRTQVSITNGELEVLKEWVPLPDDTHEDAIVNGIVKQIINRENNMSVKDDGIMSFDEAYDDAIKNGLVNPEERYKLTEEGKEAVKKALKSLPPTKTSPGFTKRLNRRIHKYERRKRMRAINSILNWLMPRSFRRYWSFWFMFVYFAMGCLIHCPEVVKAMLWPFAIALPWLRSIS